MSAFDPLQTLVDRSTHLEGASSGAASGEKTMFLRTLILTSFIMLAGVSAPVTAARRTNPVTAAQEPGLIGTWRLIRFENTPKGGTMTHPYGEHPRGYFIYDRTGHLSIHITKYPPPPPFNAGENKATDAEKIAAFDANVAYFGTYRVDKVKHVLHHQVEGALDSTYTDTDQLRPYRLIGDTLIIELDDPKDGTHYFRELHRVR
jgi:hypothetical protein